MVVSISARSRQMHDQGASIGDAATTTYSGGWLDDAAVSFPDQFHVGSNILPGSYHTLLTVLK
jgi:hypothetical protein